MIDAIEIPSR